MNILQILRRRNSGFSLIELLVVIAIIGLLAIFAIPAFNAIGQARGVTEAAYQVSGAVELARQEALSRRTYVWIGFEENANLGETDLHIGMVYSMNGTVDTSATNLSPISRVLVVHRAGLADPAAMNVGTNLSSVPGVEGNSGASFKVGSTDFTDKTITVTPTGEMMLAPLATSSDPDNAGFDPSIAIGLRQFRGTTPVTNREIAVVIDGSVGVPTIHRQ